MAMNSFEWADATTVEQAAGLLAESTEQRPVIAKAGGIDLLDLMKEGILAPARLVNLKTIRGLDEIGTEDGLTLGALVTLDRIDKDPYGSARATWRCRTRPDMRRRRRSAMPQRSVAICCSGRAAGTSATAISTAKVPARWRATASARISITRFSTTTKMRWFTPPRLRRR